MIMTKMVFRMFFKLKLYDPLFEPGNPLFSNRIVILGLMSVVLLYKIHTLNQIFIERGHAFSP